MASDNGPDLDSARDAIEALMDDACIVRYDPQGRHDDIWDHETGRRIRPNPDDSIIYDASSVGDSGRSLADDDATGGKCKLKLASNESVPRSLIEGGGQQPQSFYHFSVPWDAPILSNGATIEMVSSRRDPELDGDRQLTIKGQPKYGTMLVSRKYLAELRGEAL